MSPAEIMALTKGAPYYKERGEYLGVAARLATDLIARHRVTSALELGPYLRPLLVGADVMDARIHRDLECEGRFFQHDARRVPWPIRDRRYGLFTALQVFEHLGGRQNSAFREVARVASHAILSLPIGWATHAGDPHHNITQEQALAWFHPWAPTQIVIGNGGRFPRWIFVFENLEGGTSSLTRAIVARSYAGLRARARQSVEIALRWSRAPAPLAPRFCPICERGALAFLPYGTPPRPEARCPSCASLERHRHLWLFLRARTDLFDGREKRILHIAPERSMSRLIAGLKGVTYLSGDLVPGRATKQLDVTAMPFADASFDAILCNHVLDRVVEDRRAMRELLRVLKPGAWAIPLVPIRGDRTVEDPTVVAPEDRRRAYGHADRVRQYGRDFADRLREEGFDVTLESFAGTLTLGEARRYGVRRSETIHMCRKPA